MKTLMRNGRDRRSENPFLGHARKERVSLFGTDQRITSGPAATRLHSKAEYMTAPERFADSQIPLAPRAPSIHDPATDVHLCRATCRQAAPGGWLPVSVGPLWCAREACRFQVPTISLHRSVRKSTTARTRAVRRRSRCVTSQSSTVITFSGGSRQTRFGSRSAIQEGRIAAPMPALHAACVMRRELVARAIGE